VASRILGTSVQIKPPLPEATLLMNTAMSPGAILQAYLPTESEIRDAAAKLQAELKEIVSARTAGQDGWEIGDMNLSVKMLGTMGEAALFGIVVITRPD
jgi:hypothetical protein